MPGPAVKFHPAYADPRKGGPACVDLGHAPNDCDEGVFMPIRPIGFTAECMQCGHEPLVYQDISHRDDEVAKHVETQGHSVAIGWVEL